MAGQGRDLADPQLHRFLQRIIHMIALAHHLAQMKMQRRRAVGVIEEIQAYPDGLFVHCIDSAVVLAARAVEQDDGGSHLCAQHLADMAAAVFVQFDDGAFQQGLVLENPGCGHDGHDSGEYAPIIAQIVYSCPVVHLQNPV